MKNDRFDDLYEKTIKIIEIIKEVPFDSKDMVFQTLFEIAKQGDNSSFQKEEVSQLTQDGQELQEFIKLNKPTSNLERSLLFVYYLEQKGFKNITAKHIASCYELADLAEPGNLMQNLRDACSSRYGYLETEQNCFKTTEKGKSFCTSQI